MNCACCGVENSAKNCINDYLNGGTIILFTSHYCGCRYNAPVCSKCYSMYKGRRFNCRNCSQDGFFDVKKKKSYETVSHPSIESVVLHHNMLKLNIDSSRLFRCFGRISSDFSNWNIMCEFYSQIDTQFLPAMYHIFAVKGRRPGRGGMSQLFYSYHNFKKCKKSEYMQNVIKMFQHFAFMITCSKRIFRMSHQFDEKLYSIYQRYDRKFLSMISNWVLSKLVHSESNFIRSLK